MRAALPLLAAAFAVALPHATVVIEALHKGARMRFANLTITVPVGPTFRTALHGVSALYILENDGTSCIPYSSELASGTHGNPFTFGHPTRFLSENIAVIRSIVCTRN
ncbi:hypothetical protein F4801DRAFT_603267 [Xylaria longipes]|nr:hypothetical protein F4801DRAFT_603267 [Xylaria longipes]